MSFIKLMSFTCAVLLLLAITQMPSGYYTFLRLAVTFGSVAIIIHDIKNLHAVWLVLFVIAALFFNPVIPVYFYKKMLWTPIDIVTATVFLGYGLYHKHNNVQ